MTEQQEWKPFDQRDHEAGHPSGHDCHGEPLLDGSESCGHRFSDERDGNLGEVIDRRVQVYGDPKQIFIRIAEVWSGILGHHINPVEVPLLMAGLKMVRTQVMPDYSDNSDDIDGYMDIFRQLVGEDMIHARTVNEFIALKWPSKDEPIPYQVTDGEECIKHKEHVTTMRHSYYECPAVQPQPGTILGRDSWIPDQRYEG